MRPFKDKTSNFSQYHDEGKSYRSDLNDDDESTVMNRQNKSYHGGDGGGRDGVRDGGGEKMQNSHGGNHDRPLKNSSAQQGEFSVLVPIHRSLLSKRSIPYVQLSWCAKQYCYYYHYFSPGSYNPPGYSNSVWRQYRMNV